MARIQKMKPLTFKLVTWAFFKKSVILWKNNKKCFWKNASSNFVEPPRLHQGKYSTLVFFYWTKTDRLKFGDWSEVNRIFGCGEIMIYWQRMMIWKKVSSSFNGPPRLNRDRKSAQKSNLLISVRSNRGLLTEKSHFPTEEMVHLRWYTMWYTILDTR